MSDVNNAGSDASNRDGANGVTAGATGLAGTPGAPIVATNTPTTGSQSKREPQNSAEATGEDGGSGGNGANGIQSKAGKVTLAGGSGGAGAPGGSAEAEVTTVARDSTPQDPSSPIDAIVTTAPVYAIAKSIGGNGGDAGTPGAPAPTSAGANGGDGGASAAFARATNKGSANVEASAVALGGNGAAANGSSYVGGAGAAATASASATAGSGLVGPSQSVLARAVESGGVGGAGSDGASGGKGASSDIVNAVAASSNGGTLTLVQFAIAGAGGASEGGTAADGGAATSMLTLDDTKASGRISASVNGAMSAQGGAGGAGTYDKALKEGAGGGAGGAANAAAIITGAIGHDVIDDQKDPSGFGVLAFGGAGGNAASKANGGAGGAATAVATGMSASAIGSELSAYATGGDGGSALLSGSGGAGGSAKAMTTMSSESDGSDPLSATDDGLWIAQAFGGNGGGGDGEGQSGGAGGTATASTHGTTTSPGETIFDAVVQGGRGGYGADGASGGAGGAAAIANAVGGTTGGGTLHLRQDAFGGHGGGSAGSVSAAGATASSTLTLTDTTSTAITGEVGASGGGGGECSHFGTNASNGGAGGAATVSVSLKGAIGAAAYDIDPRTTSADQAAFMVDAAGGDGGKSGGMGKGGVGGAGTATATAKSISRADGASMGAYATGGAGGSSTTNSDGGAGGVAEATISASTTATGANASLGLYDASWGAEAIGGNGGDGNNENHLGYIDDEPQVAGDGGTAQASAQGSSSTASHILVSALARGGNGGIGQEDASGGDGAAVSLTDAVKGSTNGGVLTLAQYAIGGDGGENVGQGNCGAGGNALSNLTFNDASSADKSAYVDATSYALGGLGIGLLSPEPMDGSQGGEAISTLVLAGSNKTSKQIGPSNADAVAVGGDGGPNFDGYGIGGDAQATATGTDAWIVSHADATGGIANDVGGTATATSTGTGLKGSFSATAKTDPKTRLYDLTASASGTVDGQSRVFSSGTAFAQTSYAGALAPPKTNDQAVAEIVAYPTAASYQSVLSQNSAISAAFTSKPEFAFAGGELGGAFDTNGSSLETSNASVHLTIDSSQFTGSQDLVLGLYGGTRAGSGFTDLDFDVTSTTANGTVDLLGGPRSFSSVKAALAYFQDHPVDLGALDPGNDGNPVGLDISMSETFDTANSGFYADFFLGSRAGATQQTQSAKAAPAVVQNAEFANALFDGYFGQSGTGVASANAAQLSTSHVEMSASPIDALNAAAKPADHG